MNEIDKILSFIPEKYRSVVVVAVMASPYLTRAVYSIMNGGGIRGIIRAIWLGTNTPKNTVTAEDVAHAVNTGDTSFLVKPTPEKP